MEAWYPEAKIYYDGSNYIAIPHTTNPTRRKKRKQELITVSEEDGKLKLDKSPIVKPAVIDDDDDETIQKVQLTVEEIIAERKKQEDRERETKRESVNRRVTTRKQIFEELYSKYINLSKAERKAAILKDMLPLFKNAEAAELFVKDNLDRKHRNVIVRRMRFARKAFNQRFNFFVTLTYDDKKHDEQSFKKKLLRTISNFAVRKGWKYMGVWERGKKTDRLHFHGLFYIPEGTLSGELQEITDYNYKTHKKRTVVQNSFFLDRFGRNEFSEIDDGPLFGNAISYIMKYMEKTEERIVYSKGLYQYFISDVQGDDVLCKLDLDNEADNKLILSGKFTCWDEGCKIGIVSPETIAQMRKCN